MIPICTTSLWANNFGEMHHGWSFEWWYNLIRSPGFDTTSCILNHWTLIAQVVNVCIWWSFHIRNMQWICVIVRACQGTLLDASGHQHGTGTILPAVRECSKSGRLPQAGRAKRPHLDDRLLRVVRTMDSWPNHNSYFFSTNSMFIVFKPCCSHHYKIIENITIMVYK